MRKVSLTRSVVGTTIDANDCPIDGVKDGTYDGGADGAVIDLSKTITRGCLLGAASCSSGKEWGPDKTIVAAVGASVKC